MKRGGECGKDVACGDTLCAKQVQVLNLSGAQTQLSLLNRVSPPTRPSPPRVRVGEVQVQLPWPWLCLIPALRSSRDAEEGGSSGRVVSVERSLRSSSLTGEFTCYYSTIYMRTRTRVQMIHYNTLILPFAAAIA